MSWCDAVTDRGYERHSVPICAGLYTLSMELPIETELEEVGRWIAAVPSLAGVCVYGLSKEVAMQRVQALALRVIADRLDNGELTLGPTSVTFVEA